MISDVLVAWLHKPELREDALVWELSWYATVGMIIAVIAFEKAGLL